MDYNPGQYAEPFSIHKARVSKVLSTLCENLAISVTIGTARCWDLVKIWLQLWILNTWQSGPKARIFRRAQCPQSGPGFQKRSARWVPRAFENLALGVLHTLWEPFWAFSLHLHILCWTTEGHSRRRINFLMAGKQAGVALDHITNSKWLLLTGWV